MGGYGSGRPAQRAVIDQRRRIDVRRCSRQGWLRMGTTGTLSWTQDGDDTDSMSYRVLNGAMELHYSIMPDEDERISVRVAIPIQRVPCRFGGERNYWQCPRCCRRCEVVVMATHARWWGCRRCMRLRYQSQRLAPADRLQRRADEMYSRAGIEDDAGFVHKQKWMRWRTFGRLMDRADKLNARADAGFLVRMMRLGFFSEEAAAAFVLGESPNP